MHIDQDIRTDISQGAARLCHRRIFGRSIVLLLTVLCVVLAGFTPAMAKNSKAGKSAKAGKAAANKMFYGPEWMGGTWENGCYTSDTGEVLVNLQKEDQEPLLKLKGYKGQRILYVGASHVANTEKAVKDKEVFFYGCRSACFKWFFCPKKNGKKILSPAYQVIRTFLKTRPAGTIIIDMGGNDFSNVELYVGFYKDLLNRYPRVTFWFKGPMPHEIGHRTNGDRLDFDLRLEQEFPGRVINLFEELYSMPGFTTLDGVHFSKRMYRRIHQMTMEQIGRRVFVNMKNGKVVTKGGNA